MADINQSWEKHTGQEVETYIRGRFGDAERRIESLEDNTISEMSVEDVDDDNVRLTINNSKGVAIAGVNLPKGQADTGNRIVVTTSINNGAQYIKKGGSAILNYTFDTYNGDVPSSVNGTLTIRIQRGSTVLNEIVVSAISSYTGTLDISSYLNVAGKVGVYVIADVVFAGTESSRKTGYAGIEVVDLTLTTSFNPSGVKNGSFQVPFSLVGSGGELRTISVLIDGGDTYSDDVQTQSQNGTYNSSFTIPSLSNGVHSLQLVASRGNMYSNSIYMDFLVGTSQTLFIGISTSYEDGRIYGASDTPTIVARQFVDYSFGIIAWNSQSATTDVSVSVGNEQSSIISVGRERPVNYTGVSAVPGNSTVVLSFGGTTLEYDLVVTSGDTSIEETSPYLVKLSAAGRSNSEANPAQWGDGTVFEDFDWNTSGWSENLLHLSNGAKITTGCKPFLLSNASQAGLTIEVEFYVRNIMDRTLPIISCGEPYGENGYKGVRITAENAGCYTGKTKSVPTPETDENGDQIINVTDVGVGMSFASDMWVKAAFVIHPNTNDGHRLMELYLNGVRSKADTYDASDSWSIDSGIVIDSRGADIDVRSIRVYGRALMDFEVLDNYIVDRPTPSQIKELYDRNQVLSQSVVDYAKLRQMGKGVMILIRGNGINEVNATNNKKADFAVDKAYWFAPSGIGYGHDFVAENFTMRIQGTSSTKYPRKNYRLYLGKSVDPDITPTITCEGEVISEWSMRTDSIPSNLFCLKCDFSDSSMVMNTGGAKLFDNVMRKLNLLTPPQSVDSRVRQAIDGIPCDLFVATDDEFSNITYLGQYNLNNEKSKSDAIFGMKVSGQTYSCPITLEALNNGNPFCLFQPAGSASSQELEEQLAEHFDKGFEFNYPEDAKWANVDEGQIDAEKTAEEGHTVYSVSPLPGARAAIKRLLGWIYDCVPAATRSNPDYGTQSGWSAESKAKWVSQKFHDEASQYFNVTHLLTYYLVTEYWGSVDQRAKNILWRTWDGLKWYATFYDGDTAMGVRNDSYLVYNYDMTRDTWDTDHSKYAYEGHNSWLWCLVLANFESELKTAAAALRGVLTFDVMNDMFTNQQQKNWCEMLYNKSGEFKYIVPQIEGVPLYNQGVEEITQYYNMYALTGNRETQRTLFLRERGKLLDAKYVCGDYSNDRIAFYINRDSADAGDVFTITANGMFSFGLVDDHQNWFNNQPPVEIKDGNTTSFTLTGSISANSPHYITGASHIGVLDLTSAVAHLSGEMLLTRCVLLRELRANLQSVGGLYPVFNVGSCKVLEVIDATNLQNVLFSGLGALTRLREFHVGGTNYQSVAFAEGAPIEQLTLPSTVTSLHLVGHRHLTDEGFSIAGTSNIQELKIIGCPNIDALAILTVCPSLRRVRVDGLSGRVSLDLLHALSNCKGWDSLGVDVDYPALCGTVWLDRCAEVNELAQLNATYAELNISQCPYSHYWFADDEIDPANLTNEDNKTGYAYRENKYAHKPEYVDTTVWDINHPNGYIASGHVSLLHDKCQPCLGRLNSSGQMVATLLDKNNYYKAIEGTNVTSRVTGEVDNGEDVFILIPRYWYKGINEFKRGRKHFFLTSSEERPASTATHTYKYKLSDLTCFASKVVNYEEFTTNGEITNESIFTSANLLNNSSYDVYRVDVEGMKQVRFPTINSNLFCCVFTDSDGKVLRYHYLSLTDVVDETTGDVVNPIDFDATIGDYDFRDVPEGAKWFWFTAVSTFAEDVDVNDEVVVTDSAELEAIEPDWVEHQPELVGVYQSSVTRGTVNDVANVALEGVRSLARDNVFVQNSAQTNANWQYQSDGTLVRSLPSTTMNFSHIDMLNLCFVRGEGYSSIPYDTQKNIANLLMAWYGTRDPSPIVGYRNATGAYTDLTGLTSYNDSEYSTAHSVTWGIVDILSKNGEVMEYIATFHGSYSEYIHDSRKNPTTTANAHRTTVVRSDGSSNTLRYDLATNASGWNQFCVARVRFGKYCDITMSSTLGKSQYDTCYTDGSGNSRVSFNYLQNPNVTRHCGGNGMGLVAMHTADGNGSTNLATVGARLCFKGNIILTNG